AGIVGARRARPQGITSHAPPSQKVSQVDYAVVAPEHLLTHEEGRDPERSASARLFGRRGREPVRFRIGKGGGELASWKSDLLGYSYAHRFINGPDIGAVDRGTEPPAVLRRKAQAPRCRSGSDEKLEIEAVGRGLSERNSVVLRPALCVVAAVRPIVLPRDWLPGEGIATPQPSDLGPVHRPPIDAASGVCLEGRHLARREIRVAAAGREAELDGYSIFHQAATRTASVLPQRPSRSVACRARRLRRAVMQLTRAPGP